MDELPNITISDTDVKRRIKTQQVKRCHGTAARTATQMLIERLYQIEEMTPVLTGDDTAERDATD